MERGIKERGTGNGERERGIFKISRLRQIYSPNFLTHIPDTWPLGSDVSTTTFQIADKVILTTQRRRPTDVARPV